MTSFLQRLWLRRWVRGCVWTAVTLVTILLLAGKYADWSGATHWAAVKAMLAREGESLDLHAISPDLVSDDQNFFAIPALKDLAIVTGTADRNGNLGMKLQRLVDAGLPGEGMAGARPVLLTGAASGIATDLHGWSAWLRKDGMLPMPADSGNPGRDLLAGMSRNDGLVQELAAGLSRPESQWTPAWKIRVLPENPYLVVLAHYQATQKLVPMLCLRSVAAARSGDPADARQSLLIAMRLYRSYLQENVLIGTLVGCAESTMAVGGIWEMCDAHAGSGADFAALQQELSRQDFRAAYLSAERGEMARSANYLEVIKRTRDPLFFFATAEDYQKPENPLITPFLYLIPDGLYDSNAASIAQLHFEYGIKPVRDGEYLSLLDREKALEGLLSDHRRWFLLHMDELTASIMMPAVGNVARRAIYAQSKVNQAIAACALERYRIEHGAYPDTLEAANRPGEQDIPMDILTGKPMNYRKTPDGRYVLWSIAYNGVDHGGKRVLDAKDARSTKFSDPGYPGDWVWSYAL